MRLKSPLIAVVGWGAVVFAAVPGPLPARVVGITYAQLLADDVLRTHPELLEVSICAPAAGGAGDTVVAGPAGTVGQPAGPDEADARVSGRTLVHLAPELRRCTVVLPILATMGETIGALRLAFKAGAGGREGAFAEAAATIRNRLQLVLPGATTLFDPYTRGWSPADPLAQRLVMTALARHTDIAVVALHLTPPGEKINRVIGINRPDFIGRASDEIDTDTEKTGRIVMQVIPKTHRMEVHMPLLEADGRIVGTVCTVWLWFDEAETADRYARSLALRDELRPDIPDRAALFIPTSSNN
jgi:hypothetical protein